MGSQDLSSKDQSYISRLIGSVQKSNLITVTETIQLLKIAGYDPATIRKLEKLFPPPKKARGKGTAISSGVKKSMKQGKAKRSRSRSAPVDSPERDIPLTGGQPSPAPPGPKTPRKPARTPKPEKLTEKPAKRLRGLSGQSVRGNIPVI